MELRQLRYFTAVAEELHFGRAAAKLHMSQPPLSVQIRELEKELGVQLFQRSTRRVSLTTEGAAFHERITHLLDGLDDAVSDIRSGFRGRLRVGFVSSASVSVLPPAVRLFRGEHPRIELELHPLTSKEQVDSLHAGTLDVGLIRGTDAGPTLVYEELTDESMVAVIPASHALATCDFVSPADLADEDVVLFPYTLMPGFVMQVWGLFRSVGATPHVAQEAINHETVVGLVSAGMGISILPDSVSKFRTDGVVTRPIIPSPRTALVVATVAKAGVPRAAVDAFVNCLRAVAVSVRTEHE